MKTIIFSTVLLLPFMYLAYCDDKKYSFVGTMKMRNRRSVRQRAFKRACISHTCQNLKCNNKNGWYLYGSDWGCCGNYDGCCTWASSVCYYHDALCKCCDYSWLICGPDCKQDAECFETYEENTNKLFDKYPQLEENNIKKDSKVKIKQTADKSDKELIRKKPQLSNGQRNEVLQEDEDDVKMVKHGSKKYSNKNYIKPKILHFRKKFIKSINAISSDELFMADQPRVDSVDLGSGDGIN